MKFLSKSMNGGDVGIKGGLLDERTRLVGKFVKAREVAKEQPMEMFGICQELLAVKEIEVRCIVACEGRK